MNIFNMVFQSSICSKTNLANITLIFLSSAIREMRVAEFRGQDLFTTLVIHIHHYGNKGCGVFKRGGTKLERFLPKNQQTQRKLFNFENWIRSFQKSEF